MEKVGFAANAFFSVELFKTNSTEKIWLLKCLTPTLPHSFPELIEVLMQVAQPGDLPTRLLVSIEQHYVIRDLQTLGLTFRGYFASTDEDNLTILVREMLAPSHRKGEVSHIVLDVTLPLKHLVDLGANDYIRFSKTRESYISQISQTLFDTIPRRQIDNSPNFILPPKKLTARRHEGFSDIVNARKSAQKLRACSRLDVDLIKQIIAESFHFQENGSRPFATAGNLSALSLKILVEKVSGLADGVFAVRPMVREWEQIRSGDFVSLVRELSFSQPQFESCQVWLGIEFNFEETAEKYGPRGYRFGLLSAGALLHHLQLACTSYAIDFRHCGGFDDRLVEKLLMTDSQKAMVVCLAGLGG